VRDGTGAGERLVASELAIPPAGHRRRRATRGGKGFKAEPGQNSG